jgi:hypothetical protein
MTNVVPMKPRLNLTERADSIRAHLDRSAEHIIAAGKELIAAKEELARGEWLPFLKEIPLNEDKAQILMSIARHSVISNTDHGRYLPSSWRTIFELTKLPVATLKQKLTERAITPKTTRKEVKAMRTDTATAQATIAAGPERPQPVTPPVQPEPAKPAPTPVAPPTLTIQHGKTTGLNEAVLHRYADDGAFHSIPQMVKDIDPDGRFKLTPMSFQRLAYSFKNERKDVYVETRPGLGRQQQYRFYRQDKTIGLSVLRAKFRPVIESLRAAAALPISHQTSRRYLEAVDLLLKILRDLEAE